MKPGTGLTLHPLLALAFLPVLLLQLSYQSLVHVPGHFTQRRLLFLLYRWQEEEEEEEGEEEEREGGAETCSKCLDAVQYIYTNYTVINLLRDEEGF